MTVKDVLVIGGTGLLGYHTTRELVSRGYRVTSLSLPPVPAENLFGDLDGEPVTELLGDVTEMSDGELANLLAGMHAVIYAAGADERIVPDAPAAHFFYNANVRPTQRVARAARRVGVERFVLFGSYTAEFAELWPELGYRTRNGYPRTRLAQEEAAYLEGDGAMEVMSLRLPYIFGMMPGRMPLWEMFVNRIAATHGAIHVQRGSTSAVTVAQVAQAAVGAMERGEHGGHYAINDYALTYREFHEIICTELGRDTSDVVTVPLEAILPAMEQYDAATAAAGKEHGIHLVDSAVFQDRDAVTDPGLTHEALGIVHEDVRAAIVATIRSVISLQKA
ncbi:NAD-dependent epimerase/dehydratase family protein [Sanguibacter sp. A247]|uniref:NAD-dependent epimerase/dehydratase family protein n=1 Tax=unclassified Sanguibacter TaxID=2645534 RepID=UPI003FD80268